ncbi:MAG: DUF1015 domain-containing protein [Betaproteobacteria bacterium]
MSLTRPFRGLCPSPEYASQVAAPPYDVMSAAEARAMVEGRENSFLHVSRAEVDLPEGADQYSLAVYARSKLNFDRMVSEGILKRDAENSYYIYRLSNEFASQTGIALIASVDGYDGGNIKRHEFTRPDKEDDRVRQIDVLSAQTGPVLLAFRDRSDVKDYLSKITKLDADIDITTDQSVRHQIWKVSDPTDVQNLSGLLENIGSFYIADGHHRSAAASRVSKMRREKGTALDDGSDYFLSVAYSHSDMKILPYNRVVADLNGLSKDQFISELSKNFSVKTVPSPVTPSEKGSFGMYLDGGWYQLRFLGQAKLTDPIESLDVSILSNWVLGPILDIKDLRNDKRIDFVGGIRGTAGLVARVDSGEMACAFSLYPTQMEELMAVADRGGIMPPKSTWFEPKLADGLISHVFD